MGIVCRIGEQFLSLVGPIESVKALSRLLQQQEFYGILWKSSRGILSAYLLSFLLALILSYLSYRNSLLEDFLKPGVFVLRSLPVASFIIILLFFLGRDKLSFTISGFMSFPIFYINLLEGFHKTDHKLLGNWRKSFIFPYIEDFGISIFRQYIPYCLGQRN